MIACPFLSWSIGSAHQEEKNLAKAAIVAHEHNLKLFQNYKCRYVCTLAQADSLEKALAGEYRSKSKCEFLQVVSGDKEKFECLVPEAKPPKPEEMVKVGEDLYADSGVFLPFSLLQKGSDRLERADRVFPKEPAAAIYDKQYRRTEDFPSPLSMGVTGSLQPRAPFAILQGKAGDAVISSRGVTQQENLPVIHVGCKWHDGSEEDFYFDPQRGHLPLLVIERLMSPQAKPCPEMRTYLKAAKECNNKGWYPLHFVRINYPSRPDGSYRLVDVRVTELDTDTKITDADLTLELPAGTLIQAPSDRWWQFFRLRQNEKVTPDDITKLQDMLKKTDNRVPPQQQERMDTAIPRSSPWLTWLYIGGGAALFVTASFLTYRRYRARAG